MESITPLIKRLKSHCDPDWLAQTRVHQLSGFVENNEQVWVKREDESGFGISGTKRRKFASLLPHLASLNKPVGLIGGASSNHVVSAIQAFREADIPFRAFLKSSHMKSVPQGNGFLRSLLVKDEEVRWVAADQWEKVEQIVSEEFPEGEMLPEGGFHPGALAGACILYEDIVRNEQQIGRAFRHICIDSGTGFSAGALAAMLALSGRDTQLHVVLIAGDEPYFLAQYGRLSTWLRELLDRDIPPLQHLRLHLPLTARSFGSVNATVRLAVKHMAQTYGLLTDPVYTAKLFLTSREILGQSETEGPSLIIHSGGGTGLMGFAENFS